MKNRRTLLYFFVFSFSLNSCLAQKKKEHPLWKALNTPTSQDTTNDDYYGQGQLRYEDFVYKKNIRTVQLLDESYPLSQPLILLGSDQKLTLSFDDLEADVKSYSYSILQCNAGWQPSDLSVAEYIDGFADNSISEYRYSFNTLQHYTHYRATFPNNTTRITKSGNYIVKVFADGNPDNIIATKRFMVYQPKFSIQSRVTQASIIEERNYRQELDFTIERSGLLIPNPYNDLTVVITQNNRWDNAKTGLKPVYVKDDELIYDYDQENVFDGGNEFRNFDIKSIRYHSDRIYSVKTDSSGNDVYLYNDEKRSFRRFYSSSDINGNYLIKVQEGRNSDVEADYCRVHFFLPYEDGVIDGNFYVFGAFNGWRCNRENLMHYNPEKMGYECTLLLKQGYYNYEYVFMKDGATAADETVIEGTHYETENDYTIYVYFRQQGTFYDQLVGVKRLNSMKDY